MMSFSYYIMKIAQWIRGSAEKSLFGMHDSPASSALTFGCGREFAHSLQAWRLLIRQAWLKGLLDRLLCVGGGRNMFGSVVYGT